MKTEWPDISEHARIRRAFLTRVAICSYGHVAQLDSLAAIARKSGLTRQAVTGIVRRDKRQFVIGWELIEFLELDHALIMDTERAFRIAMEAADDTKLRGIIAGILRVPAKRVDERLLTLDRLNKWATVKKIAAVCAAVGLDPTAVTAAGAEIERLTASEVSWNGGGS